MLYVGKIKIAVQIKIDRLIGTIIVIRHRALSKVPNNKIIEHSMSMIDKY